MVEPYTKQKKPHMDIKYKLVAAAAVYCTLMTQLIAAETLKIEVDNIETSQGMLMIQIMRSEAEFSGESPAIASIMQRAQVGNATFSASNLPAGEYAIRVMHDTNGNGELDSNFVGMPNEPWAMSNNAKGNFGPPKWDDVKFTLDGEATQSLTLSK